jgi:hypothetical protein
MLCIRGATFAGPHTIKKKDLGFKAQIFVGPQFQRRVDQDETLTFWVVVVAKNTHEMPGIARRRAFRLGCAVAGAKARRFLNRLWPD